jgi:hypothetical protein
VAAREALRGRKKATDGKIVVSFWPIARHIFYRGPVAQLAEQQTLNLRVEGSIPSRLTTLSSALSDGAK